MARTTPAIARDSVDDVDQRMPCTWRGGDIFDRQVWDMIERRIEHQRRANLWRGSDLYLPDRRRGTGPLGAIEPANMRIDAVSHEFLDMIAPL